MGPTGRVPRMPLIPAQVDDRPMFETCQNDDSRHLPAGDDGLGPSKSRDKAGK